MIVRQLRATRALMRRAVLHQQPAIRRLAQPRERVSVLQRSLAKSGRSGFHQFSRGSSQSVRAQARGQWYMHRRQLSVTAARFAPDWNEGGA
jgi:hypothetical protein